MAVDSTWAERALQHARHIATRIGPRGAATPEEKQAADYAQQQMQQLGAARCACGTFRTCCQRLAADHDHIFASRCGAYSRAGVCSI